MHRGHTRTRKSPALPAMREPSRVASCQFSFCGALAEHIGEKRARVHAMRSVVRTSVDTTGLFQVRAQIARSRFLLDDRFFATCALRIVDQNFKWVQIDIAVGPILRAEAAADTPILDDDLKRIPPSIRADRTANHTHRIPPLAPPARDK